LGKQLPDDAVVGSQLAGLLRHGLRLGEAALIDEGVVFVDEHRDPLIDLDLAGPLPVDLPLDLGVAFLERQLGPPLAGRFLDVAAGPFDAAQELVLPVVRDRLARHVSRGLVEQREGVGGRLLAEPLGLELSGRHFGGNAGEQQVGSDLTGGGRRRGLRGRGAGARPPQSLVDHPLRGGGSLAGRFRGGQFLGAGSQP
jgi:hypothetical protein